MSPMTPGYGMMMRRIEQDLPSCMGGWCAMRDTCPQHNAADRSHPVERLCGPQDGVIVEWRPVMKAAA